MLKKKKKMEEEGGADAMVMDEDEKKRFEEVEKKKEGEGERGATRERRVRGGGSERSGFTHVAFELLQVNGSIFRKRKDYLEQCRCYKAILECELVKEDKSKYEPAMECVLAWLVVLSERDPMQQSLLHETLKDDRLKEMKTYEELLKKFTTYEIIRWDELSETYAEEIAKHFTTTHSNQQKEEETNIASTMKVDVSAGGGDGKSTTKLDDLQSRVIEHNLFVVAKHYKRISLSRLSELLCLTVDGRNAAYRNLSARRKYTRRSIDQTPSPPSKTSTPPPAPTTLRKPRTNFSTRG